MPSAGNTSGNGTAAGRRPRVAAGDETITGIELALHSLARRLMLARHRWFVSLLADWPAAERREFARLIARFTSDIQGHLDELNL